MAKTTPGPWKVKSHFIGPWEVWNANEESVAFVDNVPNAELIAAAPELLEACKGVTPICNAINDLIENDKDLSERFMSLLIAHGLQDDYGFNLANAIAKAEGEDTAHGQDPSEILNALTKP